MEIDSGRRTLPSGMAGLPLWGRLIITVLIAAGVGPLVGTAVIWCLASLGNDLAPAEIITAVHSFSVENTLLLGYVFGGLQAAICGGVFAACGWYFGKLPAWIAAAIALPLAFVFQVIVFGTTTAGLLTSVLIHLVPTLVVWWLVRSYWKRAEA